MRASTFVSRNHLKCQLYSFNYIYFHCTMKIQSIHTLWTYILFYLPGQGGQIGGWVPPVMLCSIHIVCCILCIYNICTSIKTHLFAYKHKIYTAKTVASIYVRLFSIFFKWPLKPAFYQYQLVIFNIYFNKNDN